MVSRVVATHHLTILVTQNRTATCGFAASLFGETNRAAAMIIIILTWGATRDGWRCWLASWVQTERIGVFRIAVVAAGTQEILQFQRGSSK